MALNIPEIRQLGESIARAFANRDFNDVDFSEVATAALERLPCPQSFDPRELSAYIQGVDFPQQISWDFSDLPILIYRDRNFYVELLLWTKATARIHQHGFCGAFKVLVGSSLHTEYEFVVQADIGNDVAVGELTARGSEHLTQGAVRKITAGASGLIHSLYHLDNPSLSLVVRTYGHSRYGPQYSYYKPALALNEFAFARDDVVAAMDRLLGVVGQWDRKSALDLLLNDASALDFARSAVLLLRNLAYFESEEQVRAYCLRVEVRHGELGRILWAAAQQARIAQSIIDARAAIVDPELRFFLALLLNVPSREALLAMVSASFPSADPIVQCSQWLIQLGQQRASLKAKFARIAMALDLESQHLGSRIGQALASVKAGDGAANLLAATLRHAHASGPTVPESDPMCSDIAVLHQQFTGIPELTALFSGGDGRLDRIELSGVAH